MYGRASVGKTQFYIKRPILPRSDDLYRCFPIPSPRIIRSISATSLSPFDPRKWAFSNASSWHEEGQLQVSGTSYGHVSVPESLLIVTLALQGLRSGKSLHRRQALPPRGTSINYHIVITHLLQGMAHERRAPAL